MFDWPARINTRTGCAALAEMPAAKTNMSSQYSKRNLGLMDILSRVLPMGKAYADIVAMLGSLFLTL
jgi:hypothetical protein